MFFFSFIIVYDLKQNRNQLFFLVLNQNYAKIKLRFR